MRYALLFSLVLLLIPGIAGALTLVAPADGESNVEVDSFFQWEEVPGASKYVLDIAGITQSEDNIPPSKCAGGMCFFPFLELTITTIEFADAYIWDMSALDAAENPISSSVQWSFTTETAPVVGPPPPGGGGGGGGGGGISAILENPISSATLPQLLEKVLNFLFGLSMVILPIIILYGGILLLTARGDPQKISRSRTILLWAVIAFAIILLARGLPPVLRELL